uniref:YTH domain-containing protein 1 n=3 Tax=Lygus hesperus TaxID=30085 RepID=A0A146M0Q0_LYGHE
MDDDVIDPENDLDFDEALAEKESTTMADFGAIGSLSDVEIDYETRSEISEDDEDNAEDTGQIASNTSEKGGRNERDKICAEKSESSKEAMLTKTNGKRRVSDTSETKEEKSRSSKRPKTDNTSTSKNNSEIEDSTLQKLSQNAKFFLMKTSDSNNLKVSQERQVWFTDPQNVTVLNAAVDASKNVILIFSAKWTGKFSGFALLKGRSKSDDPPRDWAPSVKTLGGLFHVKWLSKKELLFVSSNHLRNPCSGGKLVSICADGQEIDQTVGLELCQLLLSKGVEPKECLNQRKNEPSVESEIRIKNKGELEKSRTSTRTEHTRDTSRDEDLKRRESLERKRSSLSNDILRDRRRIRDISRSRSNLHSPRKDSIMDDKRSPKIMERRGRSPIRRERRTRKEHSTDRIERARTRKKYHSRETTRRRSTVSIDLIYKTSRGRDLSQDSYDRRGRSPEDLSPLNDRHRSRNIYSRESDILAPSGGPDTDRFEYLSDDDLDVSGEPSRMSGRFVIERSPIRQTVVSQNELSPDNYELMSENGSERHVELSNKSEAAPERYCTIATDVSVEISPSPERISEVPREVYETNESLGGLQARSRSQASYNYEDYQPDQSNGRSPSHEQNKTTYLAGNTRDIYSSNESIGKYQSRRRSPSSSRYVHAKYSSYEASRRRSSSRGIPQRMSPSPVRSHSTHRVYEQGATRKSSGSRERSLTTLREYSSYESTRMRSQYYDMPLDTNMVYQQESTERSSSHRNRPEIPRKRYSPMRETRDEEVKRHKDSRMRRSPDVISRERTPSQEFIEYERDGNIRRRAEESLRGYRSRDSDLYDKRTSPVGVSGSENRSRYSVPAEITDTSSNHRSSGSRRKIRDSSEHQEDRIKHYRDERFSYDRKSRLTPELGPRHMERAPERVPEYRHSHREQHDYERPKDYDTRRSDSAHGRTNHYYGYGSQNLAPSMVPQGFHPPTPAAPSYLPASHVNYYQGNPPPLLPPVSSKLLEPATRPSPPRYNPTVPPPIVPPAPSKYIDDVPGVPPVPPRFQQGGTIPPPPTRGQSIVGSWAPGIRNVRDNQTSRQSLSAEEFIELCKRNQPIRATTSGSHRRH